MSQTYETNFWNQRYSRNEFIYGEAPNAFFKQTLEKYPAGKLILPAEGEGRNAVYAATQGWKVDAFDSSTAGKEKAEQLARKHSVSINYQIETHDSWKPSNAEHDMATMIYAHCDSSTRTNLHQKLIASLKIGGVVVYEAFRKDQLGLESGGPKNEDMLLSKEILSHDFQVMDIQYLEEVDVELHEGDHHKGLARVIRMIAVKK